MKLPEFFRVAFGGSGAEALTGGSPLKLKAIKEFQNFYGRLKAEYEGKKLTAEIFRELKVKTRKEITTANHYLVFDVVDSKGRFVERKVFQSDRTAREVIYNYLRAGYTILHRGIYYIPKEVWKEYKACYKEVRKNPALSFEIFNLFKLIRIGDTILIDLDNVSEGDVKRLVKYLHKLGIYPEVWKSASGKGYHIYIHLIYRVVRIGEDKFYEFPYASDYRIRLIEEALKEVLRRLEIPYDSVSAKRAVWLEGVYNPLKGGKSEKVFEGLLHRIDRVFERLRPLWKKSLKERALKRFVRRKETKQGRFDITAQIEHTEASNPIYYIQANLKNGTITRLLNQGLGLYEVGEILADHYEGDEKAFKRAWERAEDFIRATFRPLKQFYKEKERKHRHYWEYIPAIKQALEEGITTISGISKKANIPKSTVWAILKQFTREQILTQTEEVIAYLKANQKGGNKLPVERARQLGKERFERYFEGFLREVIKGERKKGRGNVYPLGGNKGIDTPVWKPIDGSEEGKKTKLDDKVRSDRPLSITPEGNGRVEVGVGGKSLKFPKKLVVLTKEETGGGFGKIRFVSNQTGYVEFYGKKRRKEEVERIRPLVVGRRINADSWKLYEEAYERLMKRGIPVWGGSEESLPKVEGMEERPLIGRKLLKLIKFLYAHKFHQVDLRKKPTMGWVLRQPSVERLDLGGWGRYAFAVYEVLLELGLIDRTTEVRLPNVEPYKGREEESVTEEGTEMGSLMEEELVDFQNLEREVNEYGDYLEEIDRLIEKERQQSYFGRIETTEPESANDDEDDELYGLIFG